MSEVSAEQLERIEAKQDQIIATLAQFETAIGGFLGSVQAATQSGGMMGMLARSMVPQGVSVPPKLG